jgi:hypothetical protein
VKLKELPLSIKLNGPGPEPALNRNWGEGIEFASTSINRRIIDVADLTGGSHPVGVGASIVSAYKIQNITR